MIPFVGNHAVFLAVAIGTHAIVGYTLGAVLFDAPRAGLVGGVIADVDLLFSAAWGMPFVHRGITHTGLAAVAAVAVGACLGRRIAGGVGVGYASQLLIDASTSKGIPLAYPLSQAYVRVAVGGHAWGATLALWIGSLALLWYRRRGVPVRCSGGTEGR